MSGHVSMIRASAFPALVVLSLFSGHAVAMAQEVIEFEIGVTGLDASNLYETRGVTFPDHPTVLETPQARSGSRALHNLPAGAEFPAETLTVEFDESLDVRQAGFFLGLGGLSLPDESISVTAEMFIRVTTTLPGSPVPVTTFVPLKSQTQVLATGMSGGSTPIDKAFEFVQKPGTSPIARIEIRPDSGFAHLVMDDLAFEAGVPRPPDEPVDPPELAWTHPAEGQSFERTQPSGSYLTGTPVSFGLSVSTDVPVRLVRVTLKHPDNTSAVFDLCGGVQPACPSSRMEPDFLQEWIDELIGAGTYQIDAVAHDERGNVSSTGPLTFTVGVVNLMDTEVRIVGSREPEVPIVRDFQIRIRVAEDRELESVTLWMDDTSIRFREPFSVMPGDTSVELYGPGKLSENIAWETLSEGPHHTWYVLRMDFPLWQVGINRVIVTVKTSRSGFFPIEWKNESRLFEYELPSTDYGIGSDGASGRKGTSFALPEIPIRASGCPFILCKDADQDGLLDLWENLAVEALRPELRFDRDEDMFENPDHRVRTFTRVNPVEGEMSGIMFRYTLAYSRDYGDPFAHIDAHNGDSQRLQTLWTKDGNRLILEFVRGEGHKDVVHPSLFTWENHEGGEGSDLLSFTDNGILQIFVEEDKHGTWSSLFACLDMGFYDCGEAFPQRPAAVNVGEPDLEFGEADCTECIESPLGRPFLDLLDHVVITGPHSDFAGVFPHEAVWASLFFCGGLGWDGDCPPGIGRQMLGTITTRFPRQRDDDPRLVTPGGS